LSDADTGTLTRLLEAGSSWWSRFEVLIVAHSPRVVKALVCIALAVFAGRLCARLLHAGFARWARSTETRVDDLLLKYLGRPLRVLLPLIAVLLVLPLVDVTDLARAVMRQLLVVAAISVFGWVGVQSVRIVVDVLTERLRHAGADTLAARSGYTQLQGFRNIAVFLIAVLTIGLALLSFGGVRQIGTSLLASAGFAGIVLGIAAQRSIATVIAGVTIALAQPIRIRDVVVVEQQFGTIEEITLTYVVVRAWDLRRLVLPIDYFLERPFENWTRSSGRILATVLLYVDYSLPVDRLREELKRILEASKDWDRETWRLEVSDATERSMVLRPLMSAADADAAWRLRCEVREKLLGFIQREYPSALPHLRTDLALPRLPAQISAA
jgi:small-conductance mechanosensitive channel